MPTNTIRRQTAEALKNSRHPYRRALDEAFAGRVRVFDIADFTHLRPNDVRERCCVVVGTIQTLRVSNTEGRKVYAHHEEMEPHFSALPQTAPGLERLESGGVKFSFVNLLHVHRPLMIVDEAHNAVTGLTREMQARVNPCAIVEFTATPRLRSNILYSVTAQELKAAEMVKLPIMLSEHDTWENAVNGAIAARAALEGTAKDDADYIRPIVLFQAQPRNQEVTFRSSEETISMEVEQIPDRKIAVATGDQRELDGIDLFDRACPIEYVITVEALKEGWDCSFAYVFCSVSRIRSAVDVEQLLGRVLRMPYARRRQAGRSEQSLCLRLRAVFRPGRAGTGRQAGRHGLRGGRGARQHRAGATTECTKTRRFIQATRDDRKPTFRFTLTVSPEGLSRLKNAKHERMTLRETAEGEVEVTVIGHVDRPLELTLYKATPKAQHRNIGDAIANYRTEVEDQLSPAERGEKLTRPPPDGRNPGYARVCRH